MTIVNCKMAKILPLFLSPCPLPNSLVGVFYSDSSVRQGSCSDKWVENQLPNWVCSLAPCHPWEGHAKASLLEDETRVKVMKYSSQGHSRSPQIQPTPNMWESLVTNTDQKILSANLQICDLINVFFFLKPLTFGEAWCPKFGVVSFHQTQSPSTELNRKYKGCLGGQDG